MTRERLATGQRAQGRVYKAGGCCGLAEYYGINQRGWSPQGVIALLRQRLRTTECGRGWRSGPNGNIGFGVMVFVHKRDPDVSTSLRTSRLRAMLAYVNKHQLGTFHITKGAVNPNSNNMLFTGVWAIDRLGLQEHCRRPDKDKPVVFDAPIGE